MQELQNFSYCLDTCLTWNLHVSLAEHSGKEPLKWVVLGGELGWLLGSLLGSLRGLSVLD